MTNEIIKKLEMTVEKNDDPNAKISFRYGNTILNEDLLDELCENIATIWNEETYKIIYNENAICLNIDKQWWDEELYDKIYGIENKRNIEEEMLADAKKAFDKQKKKNNNMKKE